MLITRLSGSVDYVGCCAIVDVVPSNSRQHPDRIFCGKLVPSADGAFLSNCFRHPRVRVKLENSAKSTAGHQRISLSDLYPLVFPLPPFAEQELIIEADLNTKLKSARALHQAILRHAVTGQLVPQDPNDAPASEVLKRIAAEREARDREAAAAKRDSTGRTGRRMRRRPRNLSVDWPLPSHPRSVLRGMTMLDL